MGGGHPSAQNRRWCKEEIKEHSEYLQLTHHVAPGGVVDLGGLIFGLEERSSKVLYRPGQQQFPNLL